MAANRLVEMDAFVRVVRNQNFVAAASELRVSAGLVTRRLQQLESDLGVRLISRTTRRLSLTDAGRRYYEFCTRILKEVHEEESAIKRIRDEPVGRLTVVAPMSFGIMEMGKAVTSFMLQYPKIQVTLIIGDNGRRTFDPAEYGADVIIRFTQPKDTSLYLRKIGRMSWTLCASRAYLRKAGTPETPRELAQHSCLLTTRPFGNSAWTFQGPTGAEKVKVSGVVSPNNAITMRFMALDGAGIALLPTFCVAEDIRRRRLVRLLMNYSVPEQSICAYYPHGHQQPLNMRLFLKFLEERFKTAAWGVDD
ncbi:MAG TPA: LysR substrate-binding domain-containing protein [Beijerinckiaceae bacterium]|nr:LysR substrate-binding domain-containing protein [Beijerinckiaceae bacterium]